jgi:hypothetical protein
VFCPNCKCEYLPGVKECADCGVALVDALDSRPANHPKAGGLVSIWAGDDPGECAAVKEALGKAGILFTDQASTGYFIFPSLRLKNEIWMASADEERAEKVLLDLEGRADPTEMTPEEMESMALPESDGIDHEEVTSVPDDIPDDWDNEDVGSEGWSEVWSGGKEDLANTLAACLREIGIASRKVGEAGRWCLMVRSEQETRAKEIVREVVEASPPQ